MMTATWAKCSKLTLCVLLMGGMVTACSESPPSLDVSNIQDIAQDSGVVGNDSSSIDANRTADVVKDVLTDSAISPEVLPDTKLQGDEGPLDSASSSDTTSSDSENLKPDSGPLGQTAWGTITGACGMIGDAILIPGPTILTTTYTFNDATTFDPEPLAPGPKSRYEGENAGGSSICSEVMSMQLLIDCEGGKVLKKETEILYTGEGPKTDYITDIQGAKVGVSVTRAYLGPFVDTYTLEDATSLLTKKLGGVNESTLLVSPEDKWSKQILHIWTLDETWAQTVKTAWETLDTELKSNTIVLITVEEESDLIVTDKCD